ncbi:MAG: CotH kinase family protein, partial [Anaerovorax sp.]
VGLDQELDTFSKYAMKMNLGTTTMIEYPSKKNLTPAIQEYIEKDFSRFEKMLYSYDFNQKDCGYERKINRDSFVDYMVINEFFKNMDAGIFSTYFYKDIRGKIAIGPVWDFNNACDNYMEESYGFHSFAFPSRSRYVMLLKDPPFTEAVIRRYKELRKTVLSEEYLQGFIDETVGYLGDAVGRNDEVWGYSYDVKNLDGYNKLMPDERNLESYEEAVMQLKTFITKRGSWLDENIEILRQYSHESKVKKFNH